MFDLNPEAVIEARKAFKDLILPNISTEQSLENLSELSTFEEKLTEFEEQLAHLDSKTLTKLTEIASTVDNLLDFEKILAEMLAKS